MPQKQKKSQKFKPPVVTIAIDEMDGTIRGVKKGIKNALNGLLVVAYIGEQKYTSGFARVLRIDID